ncbi:hypothetical protein MIND_01023400 [Mycena indigotica]|uniref:BRCT domain-containing protein n=1 Tax=Mycena indigotica TaxID=2126181 RepID=A0A8H6S9X0_9AGAR|nr:uncharacterized protein MIND_01023400 [Mycena indigotica]KAF7294855.1 hypothetical protein MIND_01023400 [Mycena indigotica]
MADSQASVIVQSALKRAVPDISPTSTDVLDASNDVSDHSANNGIVPQYHYHGLATTQSPESSDPALNATTKLNNRLPPTLPHDECPPFDKRKLMGQGTILVASTPTPSASDGLLSPLPMDEDDESQAQSQSQSHSFQYPAPLPESSQDAALCIDLYTNFTPPDARRTPSEDGIRPESPEEDLEPTQIVETQIVATPIVATQIVDPPPPSSPPKNPVPLDVPIGQPRSLLDSLDSDKRQRYAHRDQRQTNFPPSPDWQETQLVTDADRVDWPKMDAVLQHTAAHSDNETEPDRIIDAVEAKPPIPDIQSLKQEEEEDEDEPPKPVQPRKRSRPKAKPAAKASSVRSRRKGGTKSDEAPETDGETLATETVADEEEYADPGPSGRKRKRQTKTEGSAARRSKGPKRESAPPDSTARRHSRRIRGGTRGNLSEPGGVRVFAQWQQGNYYPGRVVTKSGSSYAVRFDDGTDEWMKLSKIRRFELRPGDKAALKGGGAGGKLEVLNVSNFPTVKVKFNKDNLVDDIDVSELWITKGVVASWGDDRRLEAQDVVIPPPTSSTASVGQIKVVGKPFDQITFCLSHFDEPYKTQHSRKIQGGGGTVVDKWNAIIATGTETRDANQSKFTLKSQDVSVTCGESNRIFLLAAAATRTPKYLFALALGIPCLDIDVIDHSIEEDEFPEDWSRFLLPGGSLSHAVDGKHFTYSQFVATSSLAYDVSRLWDLPTAFKPFSGKSILCVGTGIFSQSKTDNPLECIPDTVLAMGASIVKAVERLNSRTTDIDSYDWVVVETQDLQKGILKQHPKCVTWNWVKRRSHCAENLN